VAGLKDISFKQSKADECIFYYNRTVLLVYVDNSILMGPDDDEIEFLMKSISSKFVIEDQGTLSEYLGIQIEYRKDGTIKLAQPHLIDTILRELGLLNNTNDVAKGKIVPATSTVILHQDVNGVRFNNATFHYRSMIGKLNYLEKSTQPDLAYAVHQCARFTSDPKVSHAIAIKNIGRCLLATRNKGIILRPRGELFECHVDASHAGDWKQEAAMEDPSTARSRTGYVIRYANCPLQWASRLQTEIALSSTEAEYIALSTAVRDVLPIQALIEETVRRKVITTATQKPTIKCTIFEDNKGTVEMANVPKMRPRTKHLNVKYHFFREFITREIMHVQFIEGVNQIADIFTKPLSEEPFLRHHLALLNW
jgi:hypothetical protein